MTGAELFVACLEAAGIEVIYGLPGEENTALMLALKTSSIRFVLTRHEQSAAFMASVYGRMTGRPAACLATLGPGATNLVTGVADATLDYAPLLTITGQGSTDRLALSESHQVIDLTALFAPVTKHSQTLMDASEIPGAVVEALRVATAPRPGAVHLSLPEDVAAQDVEAQPRSVPTRTRVISHSDAIANATSLLSNAEMPMIVAGAGVVRTGAAHRLVDFAEAHDLPLATTFMGNGIVAATHPLSLGTIGQPFEDHVDRAVRAADLVLAIGFDAIETSPAGFSGDGRPRVLHIAETAAAADLGWEVVADVAGDIDASLSALSSALGDRQWGIFEEARKAQEKIRSERARPRPSGSSAQLLPEGILAVVEEQLREQDTVVSGVGTHKLKVARSLAAKRPGQIIIANGSAGMGIALPGAMVAADLQQQGRAIAIVGDGEFLMNVQDMETAVRLKSPLTVLLWEDGGYGLIEEKQESEAGSHTDLAFGNPDWADLCRAFKWRHIPVETYADLAPALRSCRKSDGPVLITLKVDYSEGLGPNFDDKS
ncbi:acetolactate synthase large subunit [Ruegeria profundi]|uniref:Acetolactate synthase n=1 Tax=Ruegeria profundi TaxID=1685378 RepID=A0A0X3TVD0_9RHOB|nr:acetolactate synthase large subunit [Ruegeria profundi]KUJ77290.1 hypothetical protein AVO44_18085 [Ruegeria profundi]